MDRNRPDNNRLPTFPQRMTERYHALVSEPQALSRALLSPPRKSFRVNRLKTDPDSAQARMENYGCRLEPVPWYADAFVIADYPPDSPRSEPLMLPQVLGHIHMQELASMLPPLTLSNELGNAERVLDACAAPGSKSTQIASLMANRGLLVANDKQFGRIRALKFNLERQGVLNAAITNHDLRHWPSGQHYPVILLDAPCSAEGTLRKNPHLLLRWNESLLEGHRSLQTQLILRAYDLLSPGGVLLYSTCSLAPEENEAVVDTLLREREHVTIEPIQVDGITLSPGVTAFENHRFDDRVAACARAWPHLHNIDGFFMARIRKS
ncbi:NOL1/NOP2/sun family putative RNA methylase [candidate division GN15 bacterium]|nr:NOL1/NOP2/sun family putative RNA methylase [candidate division GN15 bacterium]